MAKYPNATRVEPVMPKTKIKKEWEALVKASNGTDVFGLIFAAETVLNHQDASNKERSEAANQIAKAHLRQSQDNYLKPIQYLKQAIDLGGLSNNNHYTQMLSLGQMLLAEKRYDEALAYFDRFSRETQIAEDLTILKNKGNANYRLANYSAAIAQLEKVYEIDKGADTNSVVMLINAYTKSGRKADASRLADEVAKATSTGVAAGDSVAQAKQMRVYVEGKQYDKAAKIFEDLYAKGQVLTQADYYSGLSAYSQLEGREAQSIKIINELIGKGVIKPDATVYNILAQSYYYTDQPKSAIEAWGKAAQLSAKGEYDLLQARVYAEEGEYAKAKTAAQRGLGKGVENKGDAYLIIADAESEFGLDNRAAMMAALKEAAKDPETQAEANKRLRQAGAK